MDPLFVPEPANRVRVILNTDAKNEADDQYAIVHAILTPLFELHGIIPAHFADRRGPGSLQASHEEVLKLLDLMDLKGRIPVHPGAATMLPDEKTPIPSEAPWRPYRASLPWRFAGDRRDDVPGMRLVPVAAGARVQCGNELCAHRAKPPHTRLPSRGPKVHPRGFLRQTGEVVPQSAVNISLCGGMGTFVELLSP